LCFGIDFLIINLQRVKMNHNVFHFLHDPIKVLDQLV